MLLTTSSGAFQGAYDRFMIDIFNLDPGAYASILVVAKAEGFSTEGNVLYESLIMAIPLAMAFMFPAWSAFNAGEIKGAGGFRAQIKQVVLAEIVCIILALLLYASISRAIPVEWYKSITWIFWNTDAYPIAVAPYFGFLVAMIYENPLPMLIIFITLQAWFWMWFPNITLAVSRTMLAKSFDRVFPEKLAAVHPRTRAPWVAIIVIMVIAWIFVGLFAYTPFDQFILAAPLVSIVGFAGTALAGMIMPWRRKELYKASPISKHEIGRIPTITIAGAVWVIFTIIVLILFAREPRLFFVEGWLAWVYLIGMYAVGALLYFGYKAYRKTQGIDISLAYKEIPVE
jgi:APA family basic amino acid/polyamine antiporter